MVPPKLNRRIGFGAGFLHKAPKKRKIQEKTLETSEPSKKRMIGELLEQNLTTSCRYLLVAKLVVPKKLRKTARRRLRGAAQNYTISCRLDKIFQIRKKYLLHGILKFVKQPLLKSFELKSLKPLANILQQNLNFIVSIFIPTSCAVTVQIETFPKTFHQEKIIQFK